MAAIRLRREHVDAMVAHARADAPVECCGMLGGAGGSVEVVRPATNTTASPFRFEIDPRETARIDRELDDAGLTILAIYHSHTGTPAVPSPTDVRAMAPLFGPPFVHFVIGLADAEQPEVRAWHIEPGGPVEQPYELAEE